MSRRPRPAWIDFGILGVFVLSVVALLKARYLVGSGSLFELAPVQVVLGSLTFLTGVTVIVLVFARLRLTDNTKPLALPDGSVRALIALVLLVIFVIFSNIIFGHLTHVGPSEAQFQGLTSAQVQQLGGPVIRQTDMTLRQGLVDVPLKRGDDQLYFGSYLKPSDDSSKELGQQIVTALITLVTAISAFYFGSGSVSAAAAAISTTRRPGLAVLRPSQPASLSLRDDGKYGAVEITLGGGALSTAGAKASIKRGDDTGTILSSDAPDVFVYTPGAPTDAVTIDFASLDDSGSSATLKLAVPPPAKKAAAKKVAPVRRPAAPRR